MARISYTLLKEGQNETQIEDVILARCATLQSPLNVEARSLRVYRVLAVPLPSTWLPLITGSL